MQCKPQTIKNYPAAFPECKQITVAQLKQLKSLDNSCYNIKGYISSMRICPPCPKGALCKPCPENTIYITDVFQKSFNYKESLKLIIHFSKTKQFKVGDKGIYTFLTRSNIKIEENKNLIDYQYRLLGYNTHKNN